ncbi:MAG: hypothetical protein ACXVFF_16465 [Gaiellaceae bacterium]
MPFDGERFMSSTYGYATSEWESARDWIARQLHKVARDQATITYGDLADKMAKAGLISLDPHSPALAALLGQVNVIEREAGRPLISALVVHKGGDLEPGTGFWAFARELGIDPGSGPHARLDFWTREVERCYARWAD